MITTSSANIASISKSQTQIMIRFLCSLVLAAVAVGGDKLDTNSTFLPEKGVRLSTSAPPSSTSKPPDLIIVGREGWEARPPKGTEPMENPVPYVIVHHSYIPSACYSEKDCIAAMQWMQNFHQDDRGWLDIGYSFAVGGDGRVYVGRGWSAVGAHAPNYNARSIGICVIGDWTAQLPPKYQLEAVRDLIKYGVAKGKISKDYKLHGHRQVRDTECPGDRFFEEIKTWDHFLPIPTPHE